MAEEFDRSKLNAEIEAMEAKRAADARAREEAAERERRGPAYRGVISRVREGIKAGREELREQREAQKKVYRKYDEQHPSEYGKQIGRVVERAAPAAKVVTQTAKRAAPQVKKVVVSAAARMLEPPRPRRSGAARGPVNPLGGLDGMLIGGSQPKRKPEKKAKKKSRRTPARDRSYDPYGLGDFRLL
ncbi:MAG: hypothetical protein WC343_02250 [Bacilli bacterium]|jgi:hypothetical protein